MIALTWPLAPWSGVAFAAVIAVLVGMGAGKLMDFCLGYFGHRGYVAETQEARSMRVYMEKAKQGMRD